MLTKGSLMKRFPVLIFVIIIVIVINGCFFTVDYKKNIELRQEVTTQLKEEIWVAVENAILSNHAALSSDAKFLSKKIEAAILREYASDLDKLKEDFDNKKFDEKLYNLFKSELQYDSVSQNQSSHNEAFTYILGFRDNLLAVFSDTNKQGLVTNMSWQEYFSSTANPKLTETLIQNILNKKLSDKILLYQTGSLGNTVTVEHNLASLKNIYDTYGLEGFKKFEFVNVSYITEYGDIFGADDYLYLQNVFNHKMIIVKTSNVYDTIIQDLDSDIEQIKMSAGAVLVQISDNITRKSLEFITITLCLVMLIIFSSVLYNKNLDNK